MSYELAKNEHGEVIPCECCGAEVATYVFAGDSRKKDRRLCEVCASTGLSMAFFFPEPGADTNLYKVLGRIANMLLAEIRKLKQ